MGHKTITEKLDQIQKEDLGVHFDQSLLWNELEARLDQKKPVFHTRLWVAASITLLMLLLPFVLLKDSITTDELVPNTKVEITSASPSINELLDRAELKPKDLLAYQPQLRVNKRTQSVEELIEQEPIQAFKEQVDTLSMAQVIDEPNAVETNEDPKEKPKRRVFAYQDISVIQASLEKPEIERDRGMAIKAQLQSGSRPSDVLINKELKFTLYAKQE